MGLFQWLPDNLFSILASKNKELYVDALFVLRSALKQEMTIEKSDLIARFIARLEESDFDFQAEEDEENDPALAGDSPSATAHFILRRLVQTGWVELEYQINSFDEIVTAPPYARKLLDLFYSFTDESVAEYNSYVYATYSALHTADQERNEFIYNAFLTAYDNTVKLVDELKNLYHNIRRYHQNLNDYVTANQILQGHFDEYKVLLMDRIYHPLKTLDAVPRFKVPILQILNVWMEDRAIREMIGKQALMRGKYQSEEEAAEDIILKLSEISDMYESMDHMLEEIDKKNAAYTRASIEKMQYLLNTDRSIKGKLTELLTTVSSPENVGLGEKMAEAVQLSRQNYLSEASLFVRRSRAQIRNQKPMELAEQGKRFAEAGMSEFMDRARRLYGTKKVLEYMESILKGQDSVDSSEISLCSDEDFILLMLGTLKQGEAGLPYHVRFSEGYVSNGCYRIPEMCIMKAKSKGTENHVAGTI